MQRQMDLNGLKQLVEQMEDKQMLIVSWEVEQDGAGSGEYQTGKGAITV